VDCVIAAAAIKAAIAPAVDIDTLIVDTARRRPW
jgi:hypothetical protein